MAVGTGEGQGGNCLPRPQILAEIDETPSPLDKGQEISIENFLETPLPKKQAKFFCWFSFLASKMSHIRNINMNYHIN